MSFLDLPNIYSFGHFVQYNNDLLVIFLTSKYYFSLFNPIKSNVTWGFQMFFWLRLKLCTHLILVTSQT